MIRQGRDLEERTLLVAPRGRDRLLLADVLGKAHYLPQILGDLDDLSAEIGRGAGLLLLEEEAITSEAAPALFKALAEQPAWSDLPVVILTAPSRPERQTRRMVRSLGGDANVTLLERPIRILTLLQTVESALRARRRQYEVRDFQEALELRVAERTAQLEATLKEMDAFSYTIAHDLRAPLRHLSRFSEVLELECGESLSVACADYLRRIRSGAVRMDTLVVDLLHYSRLTRVEISIRPVDVVALVSRVLRHMETDLRERKAVVTAELPPGFVLADPVLLSQALTNLLSNAVKFVAPGTAPSVRIRKEDRGPWTRIWVEDNGIGIDPRHHARIFEVFERLHSSKAYTGTGIGLSIVRRVVERQGGRAGVESQAGAGSRFWIDLRRPEPGAR